MTHHTTPSYAAALLRLMLDEGTTASDGMEGSVVAEGHRVVTADPGQLTASHVMTGEQSNTSVILDLADSLGAASNPLICKLFRVLHHGENPDVVVQSALAEAGSVRVPHPVGSVMGGGRMPTPRRARPVGTWLLPKSSSQGSMTPGGSPWQRSPRGRTSASRRTAWAWQPLRFTRPWLRP